MNILRALWRGLLVVAKRIGQIQAWLILTAFYFVIVAPIALIFKLAADPLHLRRHVSSIWTSRNVPKDLQAWAKEQF